MDVAHPPHLSALRLSPSRENEIIQELAQHLDDRWRELIAGGASEEEATRLALSQLRHDVLVRNLAPLEQTQQPPSVSPGAASGHWLRDVWRDLRYGFRAMRRKPGSAVVALATLALGIGANSAMFTIVRGVLLQPLPYARPAELVRIGGASHDRPDRTINLSRPDFRDLAHDARTLADLGAFPAGIGTFTIVDGEPERVRAVSVSAGFFRVLGVAPIEGRFFTTDDEETEADVLVISHGLWYRRFGADPAVVGRTVTLGVGPQVVVGVLPPDFRYPQPDAQGEPEVYALMTLRGEAPRSGRSIRAVGRLRPGVTVTQAQADLAAVAARLEQLYLQDNFRMGVRVEPLLDTVVARTGALRRSPIGQP